MVQRYGVGPGLGRKLLWGRVGTLWAVCRQWVALGSHVMALMVLWLYGFMVSACSFTLLRNDSLVSGRIAWDTVEGKRGGLGGGFLLLVGSIGLCYTILPCSVSSLLPVFGMLQFFSFCAFSLF